MKNSKISSIIALVAAGGVAIFVAGCTISFIPPVAVSGPPVAVAGDVPVIAVEGGVYQGVEVVPPVEIATCDWVLVDGGWNYWHPELGVWVHADRPGGWHPDHYRSLNNWGERSRDHRDRNGRMVHERSTRGSGDMRNNNGRNDLRQNQQGVNHQQVQQPRVATPRQGAKPAAKPAAKSDKKN
jgi:hypothetical protein